MAVTQKEIKSFSGPTYCHSGGNLLAGNQTSFLLNDILYLDGRITNIGRNINLLIKVGRYPAHFCPSGRIYWVI